MSPIGQLRIPGIELDVGWFSGVHPAVLERGPGHWPGTPLPGRAGNAVLSGHRTTFTEPFGDLDRLEPGDLIEAEVPGSGVITYAVQSVSVVPEATYTDVVLRQPDNPGERRLTLFACHPKGSRDERIVVDALADPVPAVGGGA